MRKGTGGEVCDVISRQNSAKLRKYFKHAVALAIEVYVQFYGGGRDDWDLRKPELERLARRAIGYVVDTRAEGVTLTSGCSGGE